ncbi:MAG: N-acetylmuramoyl-L-alanine amidase [Saprospiraceae bacterium]
MTKSNFLKLTTVLLVLPFVNIYFNDLVRPSAVDHFCTDHNLNISVGQTQHQHSCFIPQLDAETQVFETPDFGAEMGKYIKDNFGKGNNFSIKTVVIDPGHGGRDNGTSGSYAIEKDIALKIARRLGVNLKYNYPNIRVIYTRKDDRFIPLNDRARIANENDADLFISIHCNSLPKAPGNQRVKGSETYVMGLHTAEQNLAVAKRENSSILYEQDYKTQYDGYDPNSPEGHIILSMYQNAYLGQSILLADQVENKIANYAGRNSLGVKQAGFVVLKLTTMPSVLIETGYLSNSEDEAYLSSDDGQSAMALSILDAFSAYKRELEGGSAYNNAFAKNDNLTKTVRVKSSNAQLNQKPANQSPDNRTTEEYVHQASKGMAPTLMVSDSKGSTLKSSKATSSTYKILLQHSKDAANTSISPWKDIDYSIQVVRENNSYKYFVIGFRDRASATKVKEEMRQKGFREAFVVEYRDGIRID